MRNIPRAAAVTGGVLLALGAGTGMAYAGTPDTGPASCPDAHQDARGCATVATSVATTVDADADVDVDLDVLDTDALVAGALGALDLHDVLGH